MLISLDCPNFCVAIGLVKTPNKHKLIIHFVYQEKWESNQIQEEWSTPPLPSRWLHLDLTKYSGQTPSEMTPLNDCGNISLGFKQLGFLKSVSPLVLQTLRWFSKWNNLILKETLDHLSTILHLFCPQNMLLLSLAQEWLSTRNVTFVGHILDMSVFAGWLRPQSTQHVSLLQTLEEALLHNPPQPLVSQFLVHLFFIYLLASEVVLKKNVVILTDGVKNIQSLSIFRCQFLKW